MMKQLFILFVLLSCMRASAQTFAVDGIIYSVVNGNEAKIVQDAVVNKDTLRNLVIPDEVVYEGRAYPVTIIDNYALNHCSVLEQVTVGRNVHQIYMRAFSSCSPIKRLVWKPERFELVDVPTYALERSSGMGYEENHTVGGLDVSALEKVEICEGVQELWDYFITGAPITSLHLPASITKVSPYCFAFCAQLRTITVDPANSVYDSRGGCNAVIDTDTGELVVACGGTRIPATVNAIGPFAYIPCAGLKSVVIPAWITAIGYDAFYGCSQLEELHCRIADPANVTLGNNAFQTYLMGELYSGVPESCKLYVPAGSRSLYRKADQWKRFKTIIEETPYEGPEDVNGDGRVDIDDVNAVISTMLRK